MPATMADASLPIDLGDPHVDSGEDEIQRRITWRSIFNFTTREHLSVQLSAFVLAIISGALKPIMAIFLGYIFDDMAAFGADHSTKAHLLKSISVWCVALTALGIGKMVFNGAFFGLWMLFGELQAKSVRDKLFVGMLKKEMEWYDSRKNGTSSLLVRIQT